MARPPKIPYDKMPNMKFGKLKPIRIVHTSETTMWLCKCDCGKDYITSHKSLSSGNTKSCGCLRSDHNGHRKHGYCGTRLHIVWSRMVDRCHKEKDEAYKFYGGRGIKVCDEWKNDFLNFREWAYANGYDENAPKGKCTIDRIDVNGNYEPSNCRWVDMKTQSINRRNTKLYEYKGEFHTIREWSEILGVNYGSLSGRVKRNNWSIEKAIETPIYTRVNSK